MQGVDDEWEFEWEDGGQHWYRRRTSRWTIIMVGIVALFTALGVGFILLEHYVVRSQVTHAVSIIRNKESYKYHMQQHCLQCLVFVPHE